MTMSQGADHLPMARGGALFPPASLGVIGSGQLGRMFIQAAQRMGYNVGVLSATEETPPLKSRLPPLCECTSRAAGFSSPPFTHRSDWMVLKS